jgi:hypothetical protein
LSVLLSIFARRHAVQHVSGFFSVSVFNRFLKERAGRPCRIVAASLGSWVWTTFSSDRWHAVQAFSLSLSVVAPTLSQFQGFSRRRSQGLRLKSSRVFLPCSPACLPRSSRRHSSGFPRRWALWCLAQRADRPCPITLGSRVFSRCDLRFCTAGCNRFNRFLPKAHHSVSPVIFFVQLQVFILVEWIWVDFGI